MEYKKLIKTRNYKAGYVVKTGIVDGKEYGCSDFESSHAETPDGVYIGDVKLAYQLCKKRGIKPETRPGERRVCSIGFCKKENKWYGWSHRAIFGFGVGYEVKEGDCTNSSGYTQEYLDKHPEKDLSLPIGFKATSLEEAKRMAIAFADSVS